MRYRVRYRLGGAESIPKLGGNLPDAEGSTRPTRLGSRRDRSDADAGREGARGAGALADAP